MENTRGPERIRRLRILEFWCFTLGLLGIGFVLVAKDIIGAGRLREETLYLNLGPDDSLQSLVLPVAIISAVLLVFGAILSVALRKEKNAL